MNSLRAQRHNEILILREKIKQLNTELRAQITDNSQSSPSGSGSSETATDSNDNSQNGRELKLQIKNVSRIFSQPKLENVKLNIGAFFEKSMRENWRFYYFGRLFLRPILGTYWTVANFKNNNTQMNSLKQWRRVSFKRAEMHQYVQKELLLLVKENEFIDFKDLVIEDNAQQGKIEEIVENGNSINNNNNNGGVNKAQKYLKKSQVNELEIFTRTCDIVADIFNK